MTNSATISDVSLLDELKQRANDQLLKWLPDTSKTPTNLHQAMHYAVTNGGKRLRPLLVYATGLTLGAKLEQLDTAAAAIELIHCYSLVHDDLPAMDDDDYRRGQPTCHKAFDEASAILVGDGLQTRAFEILSAPSAHLSTQQQLQMINTLATASGIHGMVGGQALDLNAEGQTISLEQLENIHHHKTGALLTASVQLGIIAANCNDEFTVTQLETFARAMGLAFQVQDDILDVEGSLEALGKQPGADASHHKATYPSLIGLDKSKAHLQRLYQQSLNALDQLSQDTSLLEHLCGNLIERTS